MSLPVCPVVFADVCLDLSGRFLSSECLSVLVCLQDCLSGREG